MTPEQKQAVEMRAAGMSRKRIAEEMGKTVSAVKSLLERARRDPLVVRIMDRNGTEMVPDQAWIKEEWGSVRYSPKKEEEQDTSRGDDSDDLDWLCKRSPASAGCAGRSK